LEEIVFQKLDESIAKTGFATSSNFNPDGGELLLDAERFLLNNWPGRQPPEPEYTTSHFRDVSPDMIHPEFGRISKTHNR
jgi:hypothetical protein